MLIAIKILAETKAQITHACEYLLGVQDIYSLRKSGRQLQIPYTASVFKILAKMEIRCVEISTNPFFISLCIFAYENDDSEVSQEGFHELSIQLPQMRMLFTNKSKQICGIWQSHEDKRLSYEELPYAEGLALLAKLSNFNEVRSVVVASSQS